MWHLSPRAAREIWEPQTGACQEVDACVVKNKIAFGVNSDLGELEEEGSNECCAFVLGGERMCHKCSWE